MLQTAMEKLTILAESAKYDVSCATSGVERKNVGRMGNASCAGICHSWSADGRCISLLKVLLSNRCAYDCEYCVNRRSADVARASFEPEELADLTIEFYRRNYIEGLFLSSAVERSADATAERILRCLWLLRQQHRFAGYIHAKIIPGVSRELVAQIGLLADRLSVNIELPSSDSLGLLAPQKKPKGIFAPMRQITDTIGEQKHLSSKKGRAKSGGSAFDHQALLQNMGEGGITARPEQAPEGGKQSAALRAQGVMLDEEGLPIAVRGGGGFYNEKFAPAGQSTQMIVGASGESDRQIMLLSESLYRTFRMKRVYFSAYIPVRESPLLPGLLAPPPLAREHRLYQADWLLRFYGFSAAEILDASAPFLDPDFDPKMAWALRHIQQFPMEINKVSYEELLRIPGVGAVSAKRIIRQRRMAAVKFDDLKKIGVAVKRAKYFLTCCGRYYGGSDLTPEFIRNRLLSADEIRESLLPAKQEEQLSLFSMGQIAQTAAPLSASLLSGGALSTADLPASLLSGVAFQTVDLPSSPSDGPHRLAGQQKPALAAVSLSPPSSLLPQARGSRKASAGEKGGTGFAGLSV